MQRVGNDESALVATLALKIGTEVSVLVTAIVLVGPADTSGRRGRARRELAFWRAPAA